MNEVHWQGGGREKPIDHERLIVSMCVQKDPQCCCRDGDKVERMCHTSGEPLPLTARVSKDPSLPAHQLFKNSKISGFSYNPLCLNC